MGNTSGIGNSLTPQDYADGTRINSQVRAGLADQDPAIRKAVLNVADQPASQGRGDDRPDWRQPRK
jgi:hypothetical protein